MPRILFLTPSGQQLAEIGAEPGSLLLDVAREHDIPLHWRCGQGTCGTCRVQIRHAQQPRMAGMSRKERNVLIRQGLLPESALSGEPLIDAPQQWRLACHLPVEEGDWVVIVPPME
ncbi:2Fe-2S iron-sulfur cluster-binding protein [Paludibacterium purpuratum]|uniref:Ferredoxin n=1 Tax=Paludibacterium purpuratum TaxID=1144873 RepID=A0A4R7AZL4_9NEIS|nr:2Fe-2S iron-sulfur cluster-binding protein [Paludibacterium purpuratum]TDR73852.1 ferredoxin [Paludibacterium purpuratum]